MRAFTWSADLSKREGFNRRQAPLIAKHGSNPISDMDKMFHHRIVVLPAYSPELNPVEKLWDVVRDGICNQVFGTLEALQKAQTRLLQKSWEDARNVYPLIGGG